MTPDQDDTKKAIPSTENSSLPPEWTQEVLPFLKAMGQALNCGAFYGLSHKITASSLTESYALLTAVVAKHPRINLTVADGELLVEGQPVDGKNPFIRILTDKLKALGITGFSLLLGMSQTEFERLMNLLMSTRSLEQGTGFADLISQHNLEHVQSERVRIELVKETQAVIEKESEVKEGAAVLSAHAVEQIMAFLKGDAEPSDQILKDLTTIASDAERLANLIMEAAAIRQRAEAIAEGESLADIVVGCLRRTFDGLIREPAARTKKGKVTLKKIMRLLEKKVLDRLHALAQEADPVLDQAVTDTVEEMISDLEVDTLAAEYARKREALERAERRVLKYIRAHGDEASAAEELKERLAGAGMTPAGWRELVIKSERAGDGGFVGMSADPLSLGVLAMLLSELDTMMAGVANPHALGAKLVEIGQKAQEAAQVTQQHIEELGKVVEAETLTVGETEDEQAKSRLSRPAMMDILAEIAQELVQFLSAIDCAVHMTLEGLIGPINQDQREVLGVASDCGNRLAGLLKRLTQIVGLPKSLHPDKDQIYSGHPKLPPQRPSESP
ncbi:MAG: hypothetical protein V1791_15425 [Pseudomonadota bacterium]